MITTLIVLAVNGLGMVSTVHEGRAYDAGAPTVEYRGGKSAKAWNWWDHRPSGRIFEVDEGGGKLPGIVAKGGL